MGLLDGKVALVSGAARGQGRSHATRLAEEGADVIAFDICDQIDTVEYPMSTPDDLAQTVKAIEATGRRCFARQADVRDRAAVDAVVRDGVAELGDIDIVVANAGIMPIMGEPATRPEAWQDTVDVCLSGVFNTVEAVVPRMVERGAGGSIVLTSSAAGLKALVYEYSMANPGLIGYIAAKHGVVGLMRTYANVLGEFSIRCNSVHPGGVNTPMIMNEPLERYAAEHPTFTGSFKNTLPVDVIEPVDISNAIVFLCSDAARYITGVTVPVDAGVNAR